LFIVLKKIYYNKPYYNKTINQLFIVFKKIY